MALSVSLEPNPELVAYVEEHKARVALPFQPIPSTCPECQKECPSKIALGKHKRDEHPTEPPFDDDLREDYLDRLRAGELPIKAAKALGISALTVKRSKRVDPAFAELCELAEEEAAEDIEQILRDEALAKQPWAVNKWLAKRSKSRWSDDKNVTVTVQGEIKHTANLLEHEQRIMALQETVRERARLNGRILTAGNDDIVDAEIVE